MPNSLDILHVWREDPEESEISGQSVKEKLGSYCIGDFGHVLGTDSVDILTAYNFGPFVSWDFCICNSIFTMIGAVCGLEEYAFNLLAYERTLSGS